MDVFRRLHQLQEAVDIARALLRNAKANKASEDRIAQLKDRLEIAIATLEDFQRG